MEYIELDMTVGIDTPEVMAAKARQYVTDGFDTIKTKVGTSFAEDIARVKAIVKRLGMTLRFVWMRTRLGQQKRLSV